jgi:hypothetical protein
MKAAEISCWLCKALDTIRVDTAVDMATENRMVSVEAGTVLERRENGSPEKLGMTRDHPFANTPQELG